MLLSVEWNIKENNNTKRELYAYLVSQWCTKLHNFEELMIRVMWGLPTRKKILQAPKGKILIMIFFIPMAADNVKFHWII